MTDRSRHVVRAEHARAMAVLAADPSIRDLHLAMAAKHDQLVDREAAIAATGRKPRLPALPPQE